MLSTIKYTALAVSCAVAMQSGIAVADESKLVRVALAPQDNAEQRINLSGKLRMLSQRIPSVACQISRGVDVEGAGKLLTAAQTEFDKILNALEHGDEDLNIINPETRKKTLIRIHELRAQWEPLRIAAQAIANGTGSDEDVGVVLSQNAEVLEAAVRLVPELVKQYSNPNAVPYDKLLLIDISGRQRMLTQKVSKEACIIGTDHETAKTPADLETTIQIFEASLNALRHGMPELGLLPPPNANIETGLETVLNEWSEVKPLLEKVLGGDALASEALEKKFKGLNVTMSDMNKVVGMYADAAKPAG